MDMTCRRSPVAGAEVNEVVHPGTAKIQSTMPARDDSETTDAGVGGQKAKRPVRILGASSAGKAATGSKIRSTLQFPRHQGLGSSLDGGCTHPHANEAQRSGNFQAARRGTPRY